jgi:phosphatidylglycerophosphatase C
MPISMPTVAVFDFDKTLTTRDTLLPFLFFTHGWMKASYNLLTLTPHFIQFIFNRQSRQLVKEKILTTFYAGYSMKELQKQGQIYADQKLDKYLNLEAMERLRYHQAQQHRCLLVSASLDFYLSPWAQRQGFETVLSSQLQVSPTGQVTGKLKELNCWGPEKRRLLLSYLGPKKFYDLYVYGDSEGDREILQLADHPYYRTFH